MEYEFAPLEGITGYIYRRAYAEYFGGLDRYFSPFLVTGEGGKMKKRQLKDVLPENNRGITLVPQLLNNKADDFIRAAAQLADLGYKEVNLNLGCPSGTVVSKGRGAGFLGRPEELNRFLEEIFKKAPCGISIKTRLGMEEPEEFYQILGIYNQYPIKRLTIHPRTRKELYRGRVHREMFSYASSHSNCPLCYNGDILCEDDVEALRKDYPGLSAVMAGRGVIARPGCVTNGHGIACADEKKQHKAFTERLLADYREVLSGDVHVLHKMKEIWIYMASAFTNYERYLKKIKKTNRLSEYRTIVEALYEGEEYTYIPIEAVNSRKGVLL